MLNTPSRQLGGSDLRTATDTPVSWDLHRIDQGLHKAVSFAGELTGRVKAVADRLHGEMPAPPVEESNHPDQPGSVAMVQRSVAELQDRLELLSKQFQRIEST